MAWIRVMRHHSDKATGTIKIEHCVGGDDEDVCARARRATENKTERDLREIAAEVGVGRAPAAAGREEKSIGQRSGCCWCSSWRGDDDDHSSSRRGGYDQNDLPPTATGNDDDGYDVGALRRGVARTETGAVNFLRSVLLLTLVVATAVVSWVVFRYTRDVERKKFESGYNANAHRIIGSFHDAIGRRMGAIGSLGTSITSYALGEYSSGRRTFPFVTVPNFEAHGSDLRVLADAVIVHWMPLVTDDDRVAWEEYALANRSQIDEAYAADEAFREWQDEDFGLDEKDNSAGGGRGRLLQQDGGGGNMTVLDDGTGFHPRIWSTGAVLPKGDEPYGTGPYLPLWQRSPVSRAKQALLNMDFATTGVFRGVLPEMLNRNEAIMNRAVIPLPKWRKELMANLQLGQYRHDTERYIDEPLTFVAYPVFDSFDANKKKVAGVLATNVYWNLFFQHILPPGATGYVCVLENSFNQTLSYRIDGQDVTYLGEGGHHDAKYDHLEAHADINEYVKRMSGPETRSYTSVPLNDEYGRYTLRIYPSEETESNYTSRRPWMYTIIVALIFVFTSLLFLAFVLVVERRQRIVMERVVESSARAAATERDLNEFLAHEIRNPLSAAISAQSFAREIVDETRDITNESTRSLLQADHRIIDSSLVFIDDFLKSMLLMYRAAANKLEIKMTPTNLMGDVFEPVANMLSGRDTGVDIIVDCPPDLVIMTDGLRLKQILLNLGRNSSKFVKRGFIRLQATRVVPNDDDVAASGEEVVVDVSVADSGCGIPEGKRRLLFQKYQTSLDVVNQGNGIGLVLCKNLAHLLRGEIWLDESYDSGVVGSPGARFVVRLRVPPLPPVRESCQEAAGEGNRDAGKHGGLGVEAPPLADVLPDNVSVLFVDDDAILRKLFSRSIRKVVPEWKIQEASSGEAALVLMEMEAYDIIFCDQYMASTEEKRMLGTDTVRALRARGITCTICGLSANDMEREFLKAGADYFLSKPFPCERTALKKELLRLTTRLRNTDSGQNKKTAQAA